jgi:hypothetical protein
MFPQEEPFVYACISDSRTINAFTQIFRNATKEITILRKKNSYFK